MRPGDEYTKLADYKIKPSTAGFFAIKDGHPYSRGSGTFVSIGKIQGLLTCGHVLNAISAAGRISLAIFPVRPVDRLFSVNLDECDHIKFGPSCTEHGPDLGFLKLPIPFLDSVSQLISVKSLETGRTHAFANEEPSDESVTVLAGIVDEWTGEEDNEAVIPALMSVGRIADRVQTADGHDLFYFRPEPDENFPPPKSYGGTSGGGLWRVYPRPRDGGEIAYRLIGVAFYQTPSRQIVCHGQASLYCRLFDAIRNKWPDAG
jgi:hypothetical protein